MSAERLFYVWVTVEDSKVAEAIVGRIVRRSWRVGALGNQLVLHNDDNPVTMIAMSVARVPKDQEVIAVSNVIDEIRDVMKQLGVRHGSVVVTEAAGCTWSLGNISSSADARLAEDTKKGMN